MSKIRNVLALAGTLALLAGCERPELHDEPVETEAERGRAAGEPALEPGTTLSPERTAPGTVAQGATGTLAERPERVQPAVGVISVDVDCAPTPVFFERDSAQLDDADRQALTALAQCLKATPEGEPLQVTGMTSPTGPEAYNETLAAQRATNVVSFLRLQGVSETHFDIRAVGETGAVEGMPVLYPAQRAALAVPGEEEAEGAEREPTPGGEPTQRELGKPEAE